MFLKAGSDGKDVHVEYDVPRIYAYAREQPVGPLAYGNLPVVGGRLTLFIEGHHHHRGSEPVDFCSLLQESFLSFLETDGIDYALALRILQAREYGLPMRGVDHQRSPRHGRVILYAADEGLHLFRAVQHCVIHVDVYDVGPVFYLLRGYLQRGVIVAFGDEPREFARARDVRPFANIREIGLLSVYGICLQSAYFQQVVLTGHRTGLLVRNGGGAGTDVSRSGSAASAYYVDEALVRHLEHVVGHLFRAFAVLSQFVWQAGIWIADHRHLTERGYLPEQGHHVRCAEGAVDAEGAERVVPDGIVESFHRLSRKGPSAFV